MNTKNILRHTGMLFSLGLVLAACGDPSDRLPGSEDESESGGMDDGWDDDDDDDDGADDDDDGVGDGGADDGADDDGADDGGEPAATCGDGVINPELGEQCDDGNADELDGCQSSCRFGPSELSIDYDTASDLGAFGGNGGSDFGAECDDNEVIIGMRGRSGARVDRIQPQCGKLAMSISESGELQIEVEATEFLGQYGGGGGTEFQLECRDNEIVVGLGGRSGAELDRLRLACAPLTFVYDQEGAILVTHGEVEHTFAVGGDGGSSFDSTCPAGQVATRAFGRSGARVDRLGLTCRSAEIL